MTDHLQRSSTGSAAAAPDCAAFEATLPDYLEGDLSLPARRTADAHLAGCPACQALVDDLRALAAEAAALPPLAPERDLWSGIAERIAAPVVALGDRVAGASAPALQLQRGGAARPAAPSSRPHLAVSRRWLGAAAAALVAMTAGTTYLATRAAMPATASGSVAAVGTGQDAAAAVAEPSPTTPATGSTVALASGSGPTRPVDAPVVAPPAAARAPIARPVARPVARGGVAAAAPGAAAYDREIAALRTVVQERRSDLDSTTVAVLERNLRIIDAAIAESRTALARDPASPFLGRQLTRALDQKLELLRMAALIPRT